MAQLQYLNVRGQALAVPPTPLDVAKRRAELTQQLRAARVGFDAAFAYSDDPSVFWPNRERAALIAEIERDLAALPGVEG